jgi:recombination protein RecA
VIEWATVTHIGETLRGNTEGRMLVVETHFARQARTIPLTSLQREMVVGSVLGDATLIPTTAGSCFRVHHGSQQQAYVDWKFEVLERYVRSKPSKCRNGYYFRTVTHPEFSDLRNLFYPKDQKVVPIGLLERELTEYGLAVWFMDDGAAEGNQVRFNTQSFSKLENETIAELLRAKFGLYSRLNADKGRYRLRLRAASMDRFRSLVRRHMLPNMLYKLPP